MLEKGWVQDTGGPADPPQRRGSLVFNTQAPVSVLPVTGVWLWLSPLEPKVPYLHRGVLKLPLRCSSAQKAPSSVLAIAIV